MNYSIPPNKDVPNITTPPPTITTPRGRATRWLLGSVFSAKMMSAPVSIQARFIIPGATKPSIRPAQQPRQSTPWSIPSRRAPLAPDRKFHLYRTAGAHALLFSMAIDLEISHEWSGRGG
jgi:hypothetical protein